jgi:hypothetical protein
MLDYDWSSDVCSSDLADLVRNLSEERWVLPAPTWLRLMSQLFEAFERFPDELLAEPLCAAGIGWDLRGQLVLAPMSLNTMLATGRDVTDHTMTFSPEHVLGRPLDERSLVFQLGVLGAWLLTGWHPLEAELGGHVGGLLRAERPLAAGWKLGATPAVVSVLERALSHDAAERFPTLEAFRAALLAATSDEAPASSLDTFSVLQAATHRLVDRLVEQLWTWDTLLPATWDGLWPDKIHPLEGLSVIEDRLLERRVDRRTLRRRAEVGFSLLSWRTPPERAEDRAAFLRCDVNRWWTGVRQPQPVWAAD